MNAPTVPSAELDADALLAQLDTIHDEDPLRALQMLRGLDLRTLPANRLPRVSFLLDHVLGEKFDLWPEALAGQHVLVEQAGAGATPMILRHAAIAAQIAGDTASARAWTQALASGSDAPLATAQALVSLGAVQFSVSRQDAESAGRLVLQALRPLAALHAAGGGLDAAFGAVTNNVASELLERPLEDLSQPDLRTALHLCAEHAQRFWRRAGTWLNRERAHYLCAMTANALGQGVDGATQARAGLALLDEFDVERQENVDRAFLELELAMGLRLAQLPGRPEALERASTLATAFGQDDQDRRFAERGARNDALAAHYGR